MKVIRNYRENKRSNVRYFFNGNEVNEDTAREIKSVGGKIETERTDEWFWRNWS